MAMQADLADLTKEFGIPDNVLRALQDKGVTSVSVLVKTFEDDEQFAEFVLDTLPVKSMRMRLALKMVYLEAVSRARRCGERPRMTASPASSAAPSEKAASEPSENGEEDEASDEDAPPAFCQRLSFTLHALCMMTSISKAPGGTLVEVKNPGGGVLSKKQQKDGAEAPAHGSEEGAPGRKVRGEDRQAGSEEGEATAAREAKLSQSGCR
ncbi:unnamed protein product [Effrenium voratum]|nr:unnamed protein product [Effrenium voratum]